RPQVDEPDRQHPGSRRRGERLVRPGQAEARGADRRPGLPDRAQLRAAEPQRDREDRRRGRGAAGDLRRRAGRAPGECEAQAREDRPARGGLVAGAVEKKRRSPFARQVMLANIVIAVGFLGVLGLFAYLVSTQSAANRWSSYKPSGTDVYDKAQNMADHVAPAYKFNGQ